MCGMPEVCRSEENFTVQNYGLLPLRLHPGSSETDNFLSLERATVIVERVLNTVRKISFLHSVPPFRCSSFH